MRRILENLFRVQELDSAIRDLEERLAGVPADLAAIDSGVEAADRELSRVREKRLAQEKSRRALEQQVEDAGQAVKKHQRQVYEVKTNKEYTAMLHEIEGGKRRVSELEERILAMMEEAEGLAEAERLAALAAEEVRREAEAKRCRLQSRSGEIESKLAGATAGRQAVLDELPPDILAVYRRISRGRNGLAVVPMVGGACGGCFANLPTKLTVEVHGMEELITCETCGRILVWKPEGGPAPAGEDGPEN